MNKKKNYTLKRCAMERPILDLMWNLPDLINVLHVPKLTISFSNIDFITFLTLVTLTLIHSLTL